MAAVPGSNSGCVSGVVHAPPQQVLAALSDVEDHPSWQAFLRSSRVLERDGTGRVLLAESVVDARVRTVRYVARFEWDVPGEVSWRRVSGDLRELTARVRVSPRPDGASDVEVAVDFDAGFYVPGPVRSLVRDQALRGWLRGLDRHLAR